MKNVNPTEMFMFNEFDSKYEIRANKYSISESCPIHWHDFFEIEYIVSGKGTIKINGVSYEIKPGLIYCSNLSDYHEIIVDEEITLYNIAFTEQVINSDYLSLFLQQSNRVSTVTPEAGNKIMLILDQLIEELENNNLYSSQLIMNLFDSLLILFIRNLDTKVTSVNENFSDAIQKSILYINTHFLENPKMKDVAKMLFLEEHYFCTMFSKAVGKSYKTYLREIKLRYSAKLLCSTNLPISEVCKRSGYASFSHFSREFKSYFDTTPLTMRKSISTVRNKKSDIETVNDRKIES